MNGFRGGGGASRNGTAMVVERERDVRGDLNFDRHEFKSLLMLRRPNRRIRKHWDLDRRIELQASKREIERDLLSDLHFSVSDNRPL